MTIYLNMYILGPGFAFKSFNLKNLKTIFFFSLLILRPRDFTPEVVFV